VYNSGTFIKKNFSMNQYTANFIGCGRLGKTLAFLLKNQLTITGVVNQSFENAEQAVKFIGSGKAYHSINELPPAEIYFITTRDDEIEKIAVQLAEKIHDKNTMVVHCSGSLPSRILKKSQWQVASVHPLKSVADPEIAIHEFTGTYCAVDGDAQAVSILKKLFESIGAQIFEIKSQQKSLYHAASVMANNYLVTLHHQALKTFVEAGVDHETAKNIVSKLISDALNNLSQLSHAQALTGPIKRGDTQTIAGHMSVLQNKLTQEIYSVLGLGTLDLTEHNMELKKAMHALLIAHAKLDIPCV
jgi:predicted short-subunit dehydrogenase-like oxidoreductase (DUF2520 family)